MAERRRSGASRPRSPLPPESMNKDAKVRLVEIFETAMAQLQQCLGSRIGEEATAVLYRSAFLEACRHYPLLRNIDINATENQAELLRARLDDLVFVDLHESLVALIDTIMILVANVTGEVGVHKGRSYVQQFRQHTQE